MFDILKSAWHFYRIWRLPRQQRHEFLRNSGRYVAIWHDNGVVYIPRSKATPEELEQEILPLELAKWQRERE